MCLCALGHLELHPKAHSQSGVAELEHSARCRQQANMGGEILGGTAKMRRAGQFGCGLVWQEEFFDFGCFCPFI